MVSSRRACGLSIVSALLWLTAAGCAGSRNLATTSEPLPASQETIQSADHQVQTSAKTGRTTQALLANAATAPSNSDRTPPPHRVSNAVVLGAGFDNAPMRPMASKQPGSAGVESNVEDQANQVRLTSAHQDVAGDQVPAPSDGPRQQNPNRNEDNLPPKPSSAGSSADATERVEAEDEPLEVLDTPGAPARVTVSDVITSIHSTFPLLDAAYQEANIAAGKQLAAWGAFDTKFKGSSESGPLGFYETYRNKAGIERPLYGGADVFGGYRVGRGNFQPWYLERQTNDGGEFKAGLRVPLLRDRTIDARRAELWRATYERQRAQPDIRNQLIQFVRDGSIIYWEWIAAGQQYEIGQQALQLAEQRNSQIKRKVDVGDVDPPVLEDNLGAIAQRQAKLIDLRRKLQQTAVKLSLFLRAPDGTPIVPNELQLASFPEPTEITSEAMQLDIQAAIQSRPEIAELDAMYRKASVDLAEAQNNLLPAIDAQVQGGQDVGQPTSSKRDKSPFEIEAGIFVDVPVQRRKALGKSQAARGKMTQIAAKRRFTVDKIAAEVQAVYVALNAAYERLQQAREAKRLTEYMAAVERKKFEAGDSDLLSVVLREQYSIEAAANEVEALLEYFAARAAYFAAMAVDRPE